MLCDVQNMGSIFFFDIQLLLGCGTKGRLLAVSVRITPAIAGVPLSAYSQHSCPLSYSRNKDAPLPSFIRPLLWAPEMAAQMGSTLLKDRSGYSEDSKSQRKVERHASHWTVSFWEQLFNNQQCQNDQTVQTESVRKSSERKQTMLCDRSHANYLHSLVLGLTMSFDNSVYTCVLYK